MKKYDKIQTVFKRDPKTNVILEWEYSLPEFEYLANNVWAFSEKVRGTNIRVMINDGVVSFGGKTDDARLPYALTQSLMDIFSHQAPAMMEMFPSGGCLYGEGYGPGMDKGSGNYGRTPGFALFDVKVGEWWLRRPDVEDVGEKLSLEIAPIIGKGTLYDMVEMARAGFDSIWGPFKAEGIVARPETELKCRNGDRLITKIKHEDFRIGKVKYARV